VGPHRNRKQVSGRRPGKSILKSPTKEGRKPWGEKQAQGTGCGRLRGVEKLCINRVMRSEKGILENNREGARGLRLVYNPKGRSGKEKVAGNNLPEGGRTRNVGKDKGSK